MSALANQTNINTTRYFFATTESGEQELGTETQAAGGLTDFFVSISGPAGNSVQINQMPDVIGTVTAGGEEMLYAGTASTYKTLSSISATAAGICMSIDREPGSGVACIESYGTNGSLQGFEFLSRGVNGTLISTTSVGTNEFLSSIGRPGATAVLGTSGTFAAATVQGASVVSLDRPDNTGAGTGCFLINDLSGAGGTSQQARWAFYKYGPQTDLALGAYNDAGNFIASAMTLSRSNAAVETINQYNYPQKLLSSLVSGTQGVVANSNVVSLLFSHNSAATSNMVPGQNYLIDFPANIATGAPGGSGAWLDLGLRAGSNGSFNYLHSMFIPPGGTPVQGVAAGLVQVCDMGTTNQNIDLVGYLQGVASLSISTIQVGGGSLAYMKMLT